MSTRVVSSVYCEPQSLPATMDAIYLDLASNGVDAPYAVGSTAGIFPRSIDAHWDVSGTDDPVGAIKSAVARNSGILQSWSAFVVDFNDQVVVPTINTVVDDTKKAVPKVLDLTPWIAGAVIVGALAYALGPLLRRFGSR